MGCHIYLSLFSGPQKQEEILLKEDNSYQIIKMLTPSIPVLSLHVNLNIIMEHCKLAWAFAICQNPKQASLSNLFNINISMLHFYTSTWNTLL